MAALARLTSWGPRRELLPRPLGGSHCCPSHEHGALIPCSRPRHYWEPLPQPRAAAVAAAAAAPPQSAQGPAPAAPAAILQQEALLQSALSLAEDVEVDVTGTAHHLGLEMEWRLSFAADGSFVEELVSPQLSCSCGYDAAASRGSHTRSSSSSTATGSSSSSGSARVGAPAYFQPPGVCWSSDDGGCPRLLQLDDAEAQLLCMWVRTGLWVLPTISSSHMEIARASDKEAAACAAAVSSSLSEDEDEGEAGGSSCAAGEQLGQTVWLKLRLRGGGKLTALVEVLEADWRPLSLRLCLAGEHEVWRFSDWHQWQPGLWLAGGAVQCTTGEGGVVNDYSLSAVQVMATASCEAVDCSGTSSSSRSRRRFEQPPAPLLPPGTSFLPGLSEVVPAWHTSSGHSLVRPLVNGREVGYFLLDTGASGFVLDPVAGDALGLEAFGELQVTSIVGRVASRYRRADAFQLGPLRIDRPLLMELPMAGLVTGVPDSGRVVGIVGYDVLRRAVVHVPAPPRRPAPPAAVASAHVDSPAAAVAASMAADQLRRGALPFTLRLQHPEALEQVGSSGSSHGSSSSRAVGASSSSLSSPPAVGLTSSSSAGAAAAAALGSPATRAVEEDRSSQGSQQTAAPPASCLLSSQGVEAALAAELAIAAGSAAAMGTLEAAAAAATSGAGNAAGASSLTAGSGSQAGGAAADSPVRQDEWLPVVMVASLPHIELELVTAEGRCHRGLFMVDSGAGGLDIVLNARAAQALGLGKGSTATHIKGLGSSGSASMTARRCQLDQVWLGQHSFTGVQALYREGPGGNGGLELSQHTSGIVCGGVLGRCTLVFDYPRMRLAVRRPALAAAASAAAT